MKIGKTTFVVQEQATYCGAMVAVNAWRQHFNGCGVCIAEEAKAVAQVDAANAAENDKDAW